MQLFANIAVLAAIYALICCGYVLVYRVSRVLNLAHGEVMMLGAYLLLTLALFAGDRPLLAIAAAAGLSLGLGFVLYVALMRRMTGESVLAAVLVTVALGILLQGLVIGIWTGIDRHPREALGLANPAVAIFGGAKISAFGLALVASAAFAFAALYLFFRFTRWGIAMRAAGENPLLAAQRGIRLHLVYALAWALAALTGGTAGMLVALDQGLNANLWIVGLKAFPAALVGGLDSLRGAVLGPLIVASAEVLASQYASSLLAEVAPFVVLILMLMLRPWGLFGSKEELERV
jgi:branched-chain amino acid transport system permease protein